MATILVFNNGTGALESYTRSASQSMPYNIGGTLSVREFMGDESLGYTDTDTMQAWNLMRQEFGMPVRVDEAFVSISGSRSANHPQHYAGTAFTVGSNLSSSELEQLRKIAEGCFSYVHPRDERALSISADKRYMPSNYFLTSGFPTLRSGSKGNYVALVQEALGALGYSAGSVDGVFGVNTEAALRNFENARRVSEDGIVTRINWESLINMNSPPAA
ncbi:MAG: peptidoglycan-binding domain-containing protein [Oscillospiraceae bacterium]|nr:peptidoglycan-binding domain-containing protein [Oscillospiraceae bacterium]